jgi:outer membrane protein assembly factor BamB
MVVKNNLAVSIILLVAGLSSSTRLQAADSAFWPQFHGPGGDNHSPASGLLKKWPSEGPKLAWTAKGIGTGFSSVTLSGGMIFTAGNVGDDTVVTALGSDGKQKWQAKCGKAWTAGPGGTRATPTLEGDRLYYMNPHGDAVCLDAKTGEKIWGLNILKEFGSKNITWALAESLVIDGDHVVCLPGGPKVSMVALDKKTGKTVWKAASAEGDLAGYATPIIIKHGGLRIVLNMTAKALIGVNADSGKLLFRYPHKTAYDVNATTPIFHDGQVFISSGYGTTGSVMLKINVEGEKASVEKVWASRDLDNHHGGVILVDGCLYGAAHNFHGGRWICLDWKTGKMKYAEKGVGKGSATFAEGMLYTLSEDRGAGLVEATPEGHKLAGEFKTPAGPEGPTWAHPVVCGGRLYIRHGDNLYAYEVKE